MTNPGVISPQVFDMNYDREIDRIAHAIKDHLKKWHRKGMVLGFSGGIDSSVAGALCVQALGPDRVFGLLMPERDSSRETSRMGQLIVKHLGIQYEEEDISGSLEAVGCYRRRDEAIRIVIPEYRSDYKCKIVSPDLLGKKRFRIFSIVVESPGGKRTQARLPMAAYMQIVAATNFKQRIRKMFEYYHADRLHYAVVGTPNRLEYDQGFFVKQGDGAADIKPIAHLYKTQVYGLATHMGLPQEICDQIPTTDTYSLDQTQEEFFFGLPYDKMDLCLYGLNHGVPAIDVGAALGCTAEQIDWVYQDIKNKRRSTQYLHQPPVLIDIVSEIQS